LYCRFALYLLDLMQAKSALLILALLTIAALTSAPIVAAHQIGPNLSLTVRSGSAYVAESCSARGIMQQPLNCPLAPLQAGQIILVEVSDFPPTSVTDTMGDHFALLGEAPLPGSTYDLEVFFATTSLSGDDSVKIIGGGSFPALIVHGIAGVIGVESVSTGSGNSAAPEVTGFAPSRGTLVIAASLMHSNLGVLTTSLSAAPGYTLLTGGSANVDEDALASGNPTTSQFSLGSPLGWAEVSVALIPATSMSPIPQFGAPAILVAAIGLVLVAAMKRGNVLKL
jgi:hypothetical protein